MDDNWLAQRFDESRTHLKAVAYRMLGSASEAEDAVQETWPKLSRSDTREVGNLGGWLTTVVARVCLDMLRTRRSPREEPLDSTADPPSGGHLEDDIALADATGQALLVVLETLAPAERVAFVLHDMFDLSFDEIAPMVGRSPDAARQLASRARRRVRGSAPVPDADVTRQRELVNAFFAAARRGDFEALVAVLDPDAVMRSDGGAARPGLSQVVRGATAIAGRAITFAQPSAVLRPALVNGAAGVVVTVGREPVSVMGFTVTAGKIVEIDVVADPDRLRRLDLAVLDSARDQ